MANNKTTTVNQKMNQEQYSLIAGLDIGNGAVKGIVRSNYVDEDTIIDIGSVAARIHSAQEASMTAARNMPHDNEWVAATISDIFNNLDATYDTACLPEAGRYVIGRHAHEIRDVDPILFETGDNNQKYKQPLAFILTLGCIAGKALKDAYASLRALPDSIVVSVDVATLALPIDDYMTNREIYRQKYKENEHRVTIHNFDHDITVVIRFDNVQVFAEGAAAQYKIRSLPLETLDALLKDARENGGMSLSDFTAADILGAQGIMGVDIGEGTTNFPIYDVNGKFNPHASFSINDGYGKVLDRIRATLRSNQEQPLNFENRQALTNFLNDQNPLQRKVQAKKHAVADPIADAAIEAFADKVVDQYVRALDKFSLSVMVIYVYGGGAGVMKWALYKKLVEKTKTINGGVEAQPILYFNTEEARILNRDGLFFAAQKIYESMKRVNAK